MERPLPRGRPFCLRIRRRAACRCAGVVVPATLADALPRGDEARAGCGRTSRRRRAPWPGRDRARQRIDDVGDHIARLHPVARHRPGRPGCRRPAPGPARRPRAASARRGPPAPAAPHRQSRRAASGKPTSAAASACPELMAHIRARPGIPGWSDWQAKRDRVVREALGQLRPGAAAGLVEGLVARFVGEQIGWAPISAESGANASAEAVWV